MSKVIITVGISGSGKSTWTTEYLQAHTSYLRINRDDIRKVLVADLAGYYKRKDLFIIENAVTKLEDCVANEIITSGRNVLIDNTNLNSKYIKRWLQWMLTGDHKTLDPSTVKFKLFPVDLLVAKSRVAMRDFGWKGGEWNEAVELATQYIDKQYAEYQKIVEYLDVKHHDQIITT